MDLFFKLSNLYFWGRKKISILEDIRIQEPFCGFSAHRNGCVGSHACVTRISFHKPPVWYCNDSMNRWFLSRQLVYHFDTTFFTDSEIISTESFFQLIVCTSTSFLQKKRGYKYIFSVTFFVENDTSFHFFHEKIMSKNKTTILPLFYFYWYCCRFLWLCP